MNKKIAVDKKEPDRVYVRPGPLASPKEKGIS